MNPPSLSTKTRTTPHPRPETTRPIAIVTPVTPRDAQKITQVNRSLDDDRFLGVTATTNRVPSPRPPTRLSTSRRPRPGLDRRPDTRLEPLTERQQRTLDESIRATGGAISKRPRPGTNYQVKKGDSLSSIVKRCYGMTRHTELMRRLNRVEHPRQMQTGKLVHLPRREVLERIEDAGNNKPELAEVRRGPTGPEPDANTHELGRFTLHYEPIPVPEKVTVLRTKQTCISDKTHNFFYPFFAQVPTRAGHRDRADAQPEKRDATGVATGDGAGGQHRDRREAVAWVRAG